MKNKTQVRVLGNLSFGNDDNRSRIGNSCLDIILTSMSLHPSRPGFLGASMSSLSNACHGCRVNMRSLSSKGGLSGILDAMERHLGNARLQKQACWAILTASGDPKLARRAESDGCVGALLAAMVNFPSDSEISHYALWGLLNISLGSAELSRAVASSGAAEVAQAAVNNHFDNRDVNGKAEELMIRIGPYLKNQR